MNTHAEVKSYPAFTLTEFACDQGVQLKVECYGHVRCVKTGEVLKSKWHLWEKVGDQWQVVASTTLPGNATETDARDYLC